MGRVKLRLEIKETEATIITEDKFIPLVIEEVKHQRFLLEKYIQRDPLFLWTLKPHSVSYNAPEIIRLMASASTKVGVGPMAAVAGAIAYLAVRAAVRQGAQFIVFDNGGDIALYTEEPVIIGIYSGGKTDHLAFKVQPRNTIIGICSSSGKMGRSLSLGRADLATVISPDPALADAAATAVGNFIKNVDPTEIENAILEFLKPGIEGLMVINEGYIGLGGHLPELVFLENPIDFPFCIDQTKGS